MVYLYSVAYSMDPISFYLYLDIYCISIEESCSKFVVALCMQPWFKLHSMR